MGSLPLSIIPSLPSAQPVCCLAQLRHTAGAWTHCSIRKIQLINSNYFMLLIKTYRDAFHGLNRQTWLLSLVIFINRCGTMAIPFMSIYVTEQLHRSIADAGLIITLFGFGSLPALSLAVTSPTSWAFV